MTYALATVTPAQAWERANSLVGTEVEAGTCLKNVREWYGLPGVYSAEEAYAAHVGNLAKAAGMLYPFDPATTPKGAVLVWSGGSTKMADGTPAGHIAEYDGPGTGTCVSAGVPGDVDHVRHVPVSRIASGWPGHVLMGWVALLEDHEIPALVKAHARIDGQAAKARAAAEKKRPTLRIVDHNVHVANTAAKVTGELTTLSKRLDVDVFTLHEAYHLYEPLAKWAKAHGYVHVQAKEGEPIHHGACAEHSDSAILIRSPHVKVRGRLVMTKTWKGPKGELHDPREVPTALATIRGTKWRIASGHGPLGALDGDNLGAAWLEWVTKLGLWMHRHWPGRITVAGVDANAAAEKVKAHLGDAAIGVHGEAIDHLLVKGAHVTAIKELGAYGSDHKARLYVVEKRPKTVGTVTKTSTSADKASAK